MTAPKNPKGKLTWVGEPFYNVGLTDREMSLVIRMVDEEEFTEAEEIELTGLRRKFAHKRKLLRAREAREAKKNMVEA